MHKNGKPESSDPSKQSESYQMERRWACSQTRPVSRPYSSYPDDHPFELKKRYHLERHGDHDSILKDPSTSDTVHATRPLPLPLELDKDIEASRNVGDLPPDGGRLTWLHALARFLAVCNAQDLNRSFGAFQAYYEKVLLPTTASSKTAWIGSVQICFLLFMALLVSPAVYHGHFRACFSGGSVVLCLSMLATSYCTVWWEYFVIQGLVNGMAMEVVLASGLMVLISYFETHHLNVTTGITAAGGPIGAIIFPLIARGTIANIGFAWKVRLFALSIC